jgi:hypothetical protein
MENNELRLFDCIEGRGVGPQSRLTKLDRVCVPLKYLKRHLADPPEYIPDEYTRYGAMIDRAHSTIMRWKASLRRQEEAASNLEVSQH